MTNTKAKALEDMLREMQEYKRMKDELETMIDSLTDQIKAEMGDEEQLLIGPFKVIWRSVNQSRIDTAALKKAFPDVAAQFTKTVVTRLFKVA